MDEKALKAALARWVLAASGLAVGQIRWTRQGGAAGAGRAKAPAIYLQIASDMSYGDLEIATEAVVLVVGPLTVTGLVGNSLTATAHGLAQGDGPIRVAATVAMPGGLVDGRDYWAVPIDANHMALATSFRRAMASTTVAITSAGSGAVTIAGTGETRRAGAEQVTTARSLEHAVLVLDCYTETDFDVDGCKALLERVRRRARLPTPVEILRAANIGVLRLGTVRTLRGIRDGVLFEPRATLQVELCLSAAESETSTIIQTTEITDLGAARTYQVTTDVD